MTMRLRFRDPEKKPVPPGWLVKQLSSRTGLPPESLAKLALGEIRQVMER